MSNVYYNEPPNLGKVLIKTTLGDIEIDLWAREAPKACKNFINLCQNKYYHGTIFHRVVKGFIVQGGDPTGTGFGGSSFEGTPFNDEFHQRIKFIRRGLVAMANSGPNDNRSQFFITLGPCPELNNKHTIFGTVVSNTIYNVLKMEELEIGQDDRPIIPPKILKTIVKNANLQVINNPFKDTSTKADSIEINEDKKPDVFNHISAVKNTNLLSFGLEEDEEIMEPMKIKSCHDVLNDPRLSKEPVIDVHKFEVEKIKPVSVEKLPTLEVVLEAPVKIEPEKSNIDKIKAQQDELKEKAKSTKRKMKNLQDEAKKSAIKPELVDEAELLAGFGALRKDFTVNESIGEYILSNAKYSKRKKILPILNKNDKRELLNFEDELSQIQQKALLREREKNEDKEISLETETGWMNHLLAVDNSGPYVSNAIDANVESTERYDITDPRNPINMRKSGVKPKK